MRRIHCNSKSFIQAFFRVLGNLVLKMNRCWHQQKKASYEDGGRDLTFVEESVACPKPRRLDVLNPSFDDYIRPRLLSLNHQLDMGDSKTGAELLDMILTKGGYCMERSGVKVASASPIYCGSPPSRASNPLIQDAQFGNEKVITAPFPTAPLLPLISSSAQKGGGGCVQLKISHTPAAVQIEGFDCLSRDEGNRSISAVA